MMEQLLGLSAVGFSIVACFFAEITPQNTEPYNLIQFGALGLCGFMVWFLCDYIKNKEKTHAEERKETHKQLERLCNRLDDRPCLLRHNQE